MEAKTADKVYELARLLPVGERLRLVERIARDLSITVGSPEGQYSWLEIAGIAPGLLGGADAQEWISQSRRENDRRTGGTGADR